MTISISTLCMISAASSNNILKYDFRITLVIFITYSFRIRGCKASELHSLRSRSRYRVPQTEPSLER